MQEFRFPGTSHVLTVYDEDSGRENHWGWQRAAPGREKARKAGEQLALGKMPRRSPGKRPCSSRLVGFQPPMKWLRDNGFTTTSYHSGGRWKDGGRERVSPHLDMGDTSARYLYEVENGKEPPRRDPRHAPGQWSYTGGDPFVVAPNEAALVAA